MARVFGRSARAHDEPPKPVDDYEKGIDMLGFFYVIKQYEAGVQFRLGRVKGGARGPGAIFVIPLVDRVRRVSLRLVPLPSEAPRLISPDNLCVGTSHPA